VQPPLQERPSFHRSGGGLRFVNDFLYQSECSFDSIPHGDQHFQLNLGLRVQLDVSFSIPNDLEDVRQVLANTLPWGHY